MPADHRYHPVGDHGQEHRRHHERQHGLGRGVVGRGEVHHAAGGGARGDQGALDPGRLARPGQAERQQREDRHPDIQRQRLDPARGALVLGVEHVPVLSIQADREQADAEQEQQPGCDGDQDAARPAATPPSPGQGRANIVLAVHRAKDRAGPLPVRAVRGGSRYGVNHGDGLRSSLPGRWPVSLPPSCGTGWRPPDGGPISSSGRRLSRAAAPRSCKRSGRCGVDHWSFRHQPGSLRPPEPRLMTSTAAAATH